ncbi:MAG: tetratricopeptide repeat protein, partial [Helicobacteraceae bacterium]|nr:tetratricopeptide repeat protein [Helicobacteraceae bacterium]
TYDDLGDRKQAIADYTQVIKLVPNYANAYVNRGLAYADLGDRKQAIADYTEAIKIDPNYADVYNNRGGTYDDLGDYKSATEEARKACELSACGALQNLTKNKQLRD